MNKIFECKIKYNKVLEDGKEKMVTEKYLVSAMSFTEAEANFIKEITPYISGEFFIDDISRADYSELFLSEDESADKYYDAKLAFITLDEKSGKEKKTNVNMLVRASDMRDAMNKLDEGMKGSMCDYQSVKLQENSLVDVFIY